MLLSINVNIHLCPSKSNFYHLLFVQLSSSD
jgi:hypothetical protein